MFDGACIVTGMFSFCRGSCFLNLNSFFVMDRPEEFLWIPDENAARDKKWQVQFIEVNNCNVFCKGCGRTSHPAELRIILSIFFRNLVAYLCPNKFWPVGIIYN